MIKTLGEYVKSAVLQNFAIADYERLWSAEYLYTWAVKEILIDKKIPTTIADQAALYLLLQDFSVASVNERYAIFQRVKDSEKKDWHRTALDMAREYAKATSSFYGEKYLKLNNVSGARYLDSSTSIYEQSNDPTIVFLFIEGGMLFSDTHFNNCVNLRQVVISNCSGLAPKMFEGCTSLQKVYLYNSTCNGDLILPSGCQLLKVGGASAAPAIDNGKIADLEATIEDLKKQVSDANIVIQEDIASTKQLNDDLVAARQRITELESSQADPELERKLNDARQRITELESKQADPELERKLKEAEGKLASTVSQDKVDELMHKLMDTTQSLASAQSEKEELSKKLAEMEERLKAQQEQYKQAYVEHDQLKEANAQLTADLDAKSEEHTAYVDEASKLIHTLEDEVSTLTAKVTAYENQTMPDMTNFPNLRMFCNDKMIAAFYAYFGDNGFYAWADKQEIALATGYKPAHFDELPDEARYRSLYNFDNQYPLASKFFDVATIKACIEKDPNYEVNVFKPLYEKACVLFYKFGVEEGKGKDIDELMQHHSSTKAVPTEEGYVRAMNTLKNLLEDGKLSKRHLDAIRELIKDTDTKSDKHEEIMQTIEKHGYTEADYSELYDECLHSISPTEVKYTFPEDMDTLVSERMEGYLSGDRLEKPEPTMEDVEHVIREKLDLSDDTDISMYLEQIEAYAQVLGGQYSSKMQCMYDCAQKYITKKV